METNIEGFTYETSMNFDFMIIVIRLKCKPIKTPENQDLTQSKGRQLVKVTFLILEANLGIISLIKYLFCIQSQNVVEMDVSDKPKDHNIQVPVYIHVA